MSSLRQFIHFNVVALLFALALLATPAGADPALWHLSDEDSDIYLLGTVHILPPELVWSTPEIEQAFQSSDNVWFEAPANDPAAQMQMLVLVQQLGLNPASSPLSTQISPDARQALAEFASQIGLPVAGLEPLRPWLAAVTLTAAYVQSQGFDPQSGVEAQLWPLANDAGKSLNYFETLEEQLRFFADLPKAVEVSLFEQTVLEYRNASDQLQSLVSAWAAGNLMEIDQLVNGEMRRQAPEVYEVVISQRNESWVNEIRRLLDGSGSHFIALGAGHLAGAEGVVERLRATGIEVSGP